MSIDAESTTAGARSAAAGGTASVPLAADHGAVDPQHPWLGLASFTEETRAYFYGREEEIAELCRRVQRKLLTILFGQSGLGKTSILRAGIVPRLRPEGYCPVYVRLDYSPESPSPSEQIKQAIFRATQTSGEWTQTGSAVAGESLWEFLHHRDDILRDASGKTLIPLLIFDQFEEIFTLAQSDDFGRKRAAQFLEDLADLVENRAPKALEARMDQDDTTVERFDFTRSDYRILIALREDYLAHLESVKGIMPSITQNRMRLARMTGQQALAAVVKPGGKLVSEEVAASIVRFIAGGSELPNAEVEPSLLSLICRELNAARIAQGRPEISADLLAGSRDTILTEFYERAIADQPLGVRMFIEDQMLTESGFRESLAEERVLKAFAAVGAPVDTLAKLVDRRLLRIEERLDVRRVELTHDVLCSVVRASRDLRHEREARDEAERQLVAQRDRERATRKALVRARQIAAVCAVLAVGAVVSAVFGYLSTRRAQQAELRASQTQQMAESARGEAEKLIVYLLDDFYLELEPVGRLDIVSELSKRALHYYDALPPELRTPETDRNRALALVRYGSVLRTQAKLDESEKALTEAVGVLDKQYKGGDHSEMTSIGLGMGLMGLARVNDSANRGAEARAYAAQAQGALKPLMAAATPSVAVRRAYGNAMNYVGFTQLRNEQQDLAVPSFEEARSAFRSVDGLSLADLPSASAYTESSAWQVEALLGAGRKDDARRVGEEAAALAGQVLERRPGDMLAIRARALVNSDLGSADLDDLHVAKALELNQRSIDDWDSIVRLDPSNSIAWSNLQANELQAADQVYRLGRVNENTERLRAALAIQKRTNMSGMLARNLFWAASWLNVVYADMGNRKGAEAAYVEARRMFDIGIAGMPAASYDVAIAHAYMDTSGLAVPAAAGDYATVRTRALDAIQRLEALKPANPQQEIVRNKVLLLLYSPLADANYQLHDYAAADEQMKRAVAIRKLIPKHTLQDQRDASDELIYSAMTAVQLGRYDEAQAIIEPVLKFHRELYARPGNDDLTQHIELALALYVSSLAAPHRKPAQLAEAVAIMDSLPPAMRQLISMKVWRDRIAQEQKRQH
jgi:tetratricopeptide (TPR) repeat protein